MEEQQQALMTMKEDMEREAGRFEVLTAPIHEQLHTQKLRISGLLFEAEKEQLARKAVERRNEFLESASAQLTETVKALTASVASLRSDKIHFQDLYTQLRSRLDERERYLEQRETMLMESEQRRCSSSRILQCVLALHLRSLRTHPFLLCRFAVLQYKPTSSPKFYRYMNQDLKHLAANHA